MPHANPSSYVRLPSGPHTARIGFKVSGMDDVIRGLRELENSVATRIAKSGMKKAAQPIVNAAKALAPVLSGDLKASIGTRVMVYQRDVGFGSTGGGFNTRGTVVAVIGAKYAQQRVVGRKRHGGVRRHIPALIAHLVEFGTAPHSLATRVDMKRIRGGKTVWNELARQSPQEGVKEQERARQIARDFFYRKDAKGEKSLHPGAQAKPFMRPAYESRKQAALAVLRAELSAAITSAIGKAAG